MVDENIGGGSVRKKHLRRQKKLARKKLKRKKMKAAQKIYEMHRREVSKEAPKKEVRRGIPRVVLPS